MPARERYDIGDLVEEIIDRKYEHKASVATIHAIDGHQADLRVDKSVFRNAEVVGNIEMLAIGDRVPIAWIDNRPIVTVPSTSVVSGTGSYKVTDPVTFDNITIERSPQGVRVRLGGISIDHLDFIPALEGHVHDNDLLNLGGWQVTENGVLFSGATFLSPEGISLGYGDDVLKMSGSNAKYRLWAGAILPEEANFSLQKSGDVYIGGYLNNQTIEMAIMRVMFQSISWAQFAMFETFDDEVKRDDSATTVRLATVLQGILYNGDNNEVSVDFVFTSKEYTDITEVENGTSTGVGAGYLEDTNKDWFNDQWNEYTLVDSAVSSFAITDTDGSLERVEVSGTPASGAYTIKSANPSWFIAFMEVLDSDSGGDGEVKLEVSFNGGTNYQTVYDSLTNQDDRGKTLAVGNTGDDPMFKITLTNDGSGDGPQVSNVMIAFDPPIWGLEGTVDA